MEGTTETINWEDNTTERRMSFRSHPRRFSVEPSVSPYLRVGPSRFRIARESAEQI